MTNSYDTWDITIDNPFDGDFNNFSVNNPSLLHLKKKAGPYFISFGSLNLMVTR